MLSPLDFLADLSNPLLSFLPKALLIAVMSSVVCGVIGTYVVLRGMAFIGDAVAHAVFPGLSIAFVLQGSRSSSAGWSRASPRPCSWRCSRRTGG
ncbi:metal ABC transporter permease [Microbacterium sp. gxy059]|uniref:metal ABC transporter permease n=1 Tax=Microbacterium sp. gxy059 TaxID=2957199 RepID=UPI003D95A93E